MEIYPDLLCSQFSAFEKSEACSGTLASPVRAILFRTRCQTYNRVRAPIDTAA